MVSADGRIEVNPAALQQLARYLDDDTGAGEHGAADLRASTAPSGRPVLDAAIEAFAVDYARALSGLAGAAGALASQLRDASQDYLSTDHTAVTPAAVTRAAVTRGRAR